MFITFEGPEGSGKTTQVRRTVAFLREQGLEVLQTREPGGTPISDKIRELLMDKEHHKMHPQTELLLFCASRAQLVEETLRPFLTNGGVVVCDRYTDSTLAYQGYGHGLHVETLRTIIHFATGGLRPDVTLFLDMPPDQSLDRRRQASLFGEEWTRLDDMALSFHFRVYEGYQRLMAAEPKRFVRINADQSEDAVQAEIAEVLRKRLKLGAYAQLETQETAEAAAQAAV